MRFALTDEQADFAASLDALLSSADVVGAARRWAEGDHADGLKLWARLTETGLPALLVPEGSGGLGASQVELVVAFEALGRHLVPGPWVESAAYLPTALSADPSHLRPDSRRVAADVTGRPELARIADGMLGTVAAPPHTPYALDADAASLMYVAAPDALRIAMLGDAVTSVDPTRRLFEVEAAQVVEAGDRTAAAFDTAVLAVSAQLLGLGEHLLAESVAYAKQRRQFGREIGSYQAVKHALADVRIALDFARPLIYGAALSAGCPDASRDASAAKVAAGDAAYLAARTALQVHGAIGYTRELDLSMWVLKVRALVSAWGTPAYHRSRILDALVAP